MPTEKQEALSPCRAWNSFVVVSSSNRLIFPTQTSPSNVSNMNTKWGWSMSLIELPTSISTDHKARQLCPCWRKGEGWGGRSPENIERSKERSRELLACLSASLPACLTTCLPLYLPAALPASLPVYLCCTCTMPSFPLTHEVAYPHSSQ